MNSMPRSPRNAKARPAVRTRAPEQRQPSTSDPDLAFALRLTLSITAASSEGELNARTVEAAGQLTGATVACALDPAVGKGQTWGEARLAAALLDSVRVAPPAEQPYGRTDGFAHLGLPTALTAADSGLLVVVAATAPDWFAPEAGHVLGLVVSHATTARERLRELAMLSRLADRDPLTGLRHYRPFEERLATSLPDRTAVVAIDIDNFKQINDVHGHQAGDAALVALVAALGRALRGDDHIYRIGGDEFAVVVDVAGPSEVGGITRRLLLAARSVGYPISLGAALRKPNESGRDTLLRADRALYQAKREGRNTARVAA